MSGFHRMVDMARSPDEVKKDLMPTASSSPEITAPVYPYGLCISLTEDELEKLNIDTSDCAVGDMIHLFAIAKVTSKNENEYEKPDGSRKQCCRIELQLTHLGLEDEDREDEPGEPRERAKRRYGDDAKAEPKETVEKPDSDGGMRLDKGRYRAA